MLFVCFFCFAGVARQANQFRGARRFLKCGIGRRFRFDGEASFRILGMGMPEKTSAHTAGNSGDAPPNIWGGAALFGRAIIGPPDSDGAGWGYRRVPAMAS